ncbi:MAG: hypothetical protein Q9160_002829 [Pyrenula sp. 1 TL-2023]
MAPGSASGCADKELRSTFDDLKALLYRVLVDEQELESRLITSIKTISTSVHLNVFKLDDTVPHDLPFAIFDKVRFDSAWEIFESEIQAGDFRLRWLRMKQPSSPVLDVQHAATIETNLLECLESVDDGKDDAESLADIAGWHIREPDDDYREKHLETFYRIIPAVFHAQRQDTPHMACTLLNIGIADGQETYSELIMLLRFMLSAIQHECKEKPSKQQHTVFPVSSQLDTAI